MSSKLQVKNLDRTVGSREERRVSWGKIGHFEGERASHDCLMHDESGSEVGRKAYRSRRTGADNAVTDFCRCGATACTERVVLSEAKSKIFICAEHQQRLTYHEDQDSSTVHVTRCNQPDATKRTWAS